MKICFLDNTKIPYTSKDLTHSIIRGAESILINLSKEFNKLGHHVTVYNHTDGNQIIDNIKWSNLKYTDPLENYDLAITNNDIRLFNLVKANRYVAFSHSIQSLEKFIRKKQLISFLKYKPKIVLLSNYHENNRNFILKMFGTIKVDWAVDQIFLDTHINSNFNEEIAIFTSRNDRNLDMLIDIWKKKIFPINNKLKLLCTPSSLIDENFGIFPRSFSSRKFLIKDMLKSKIFLVPGHKSELFCLAAEEARELCIPIVTLGIGALSERVQHSKTGFIAKNSEEFAYYTLKIFKDIDLWNELRNNLFRLRGSKVWSNVASKILKNI